MIELFAGLAPIGALCNGGSYLGGVDHREAEGLGLGCLDQPSSAQVGDRSHPLNKWIFLNLGVGAHVAFMSFLSASFRGRLPFAPIATGVFFVAWVVVVAAFVYHMWDALPSTHRRLTPWSAVGLLTVPIWGPLRVFAGFAADFNQHVAARGYEDVPRVSRWLQIAAVVSVLIPVLSSVLMGMVVLNVCNAVTGLKELEAEATTDTPTPPQRILVT